MVRNAPLSRAALVFALAVSTLDAQDIDRVIAILKSKPTVAAPSVERTVEPPPAADATPRFLLRDRSRVAGTPHVEALRVTTKFGALEIPVAELERVRFARRIEPEVRVAIDTQIARLGADDFDEREAAMDDLRRIGPVALEPLRAAARSEDDEVKNRAELLVEELEQASRSSSQDEGEPGLRGTEDEIRTRRMTLRGTVVAESFAIASRYGELVIRVEDLEGIQFRSAGPSTRRVDVTPDIQPPGKWLDTRLDVEKKQLVRVEASGTMEVSDWGFNSGPDGNSRYSGNTFGGFPPLTLIGKIGNNGKPFKVGANYKAKADAKGRLYLAVVPFMYSPTSTTGKFSAKLEIAPAP